MKKRLLSGIVVFTLCTAFSSFFCSCVTKKTVPQEQTALTKQPAGNAAGPHTRIANINNTIDNQTVRNTVPSTNNR